MPQQQSITTTGAKNVGQSKPITTKPAAPVQQSVKQSQDPAKTAAGNGSAKKPGHRRFATCSIVMVTVVLLMLLLFAALLAKTGLVRVPLISNFFQPPAPIRAVSAKPISWPAFQELVVAKIVAGQAGEAVDSYAFLITEEEATGLLQGTIMGGLNSDQYKINSSQIVITPQEVELFIVAEWKFIDIDLTIRAMPVIKDGVLEFESVRVWIGTLRMPVFIANQLAGLLFSRDLGTWQVRVNDQIIIKELLLLDGEMRVKLGG